MFASDTLLMDQMMSETLTLPQSKLFEEAAQDASSPPGSVK